MPAPPVSVYAAAAVIMSPAGTVKNQKNEQNTEDGLFCADFAEKPELFMRDSAEKREK
jgi:hypothetical protein